MYRGAITQAHNPQLQLNSFKNRHIWRDLDLNFGYNFYGNSKGAASCFCRNSGQDVGDKMETITYSPILAGAENMCIEIEVSWFIPKLYLDDHN